MNCDDEYTPEKLIQEYYEVYLVERIDILRQYYSDSEIASILTVSLTESSSEFDSYLSNKIDSLGKAIAEVNSIKVIYRVLRRILTGTLDREDSLMINLRKIAPTVPLVELNALVRKQITIIFLFPKLEAISEINESHLSNKLC